MTSDPGIEPGPHWWKASALTTAPTLLPKNEVSSNQADVYLKLVLLPSLSYFVRLVKSVGAQEQILSNLFHKFHLVAFLENELFSHGNYFLMSRFILAY